MPVRKIGFELSATTGCLGGYHFGQVVGKKQYHATNRLAYVTDGAAGANYNTDIDNQATDNYKYDAVGNLIEDAAEEIAAIEWNANGKIKSIQRTATSNKSDLEFVYDAAGNRIIKIVKPRDGAGLKSQLHWTYTYYVRDANGNVMAVYQRSFQHISDADYNDQLNCAELHLYGSKRVGTNNVDSLATYTFTDASFTDNYGNTFGAAIYDALPPVTPCTTACKNNYRRKLGKKQYEIPNHLGNVLATVSDRKLSKDVYSYTTSGSGNYKYDAVRNMYHAVTAGTGTHNRVTSSSDNKTDWYTADVISYSDYYAYGEQQHGRFGGVYRYDFNGKETDPESDLQDYGARIYNNRLGKWLSTDPLQADYPSISPYTYVANTPLQAIDPDGRLIIFVNGQWGSTFGLPWQGGLLDYWGDQGEYAKGWMANIGDYHAWFVDGSIGGQANTTMHMPYTLDRSNIDLTTRFNAGYKFGQIVAAGIIGSLQRDPNNPQHIVESVKFITHSMGAAFQRGMSLALVQYVIDYNKQVDAFNQDALDYNYVCQCVDLKTRLTGFQIEFTVDIDPFQGSSLYKDFTADKNFYILADDTDKKSSVFDKFVGSAVPGAKQMGLDANGNTMMHGHWLSYAKDIEFPQGTRNNTFYNKNNFKAGFQSGSLFNLQFIPLR